MLWGGGGGGLKYRVGYMNFHAVSRGRVIFNFDIPVVGGGGGGGGSC